KKVFFVLSSLGAGGSERVFWNLSQGFNKEKFDITMVLLDSKVNCYSMALENVNFIDLKTKKASRSFFPLYTVLKKEKPYAVFSTTDHINILVSIVSKFLNIPFLIARASNLPHEQVLYMDLKSRFYELFAKVCYRNYKLIVCQSQEMKESLINTYGLDHKMITVIANPIIHTPKVKEFKNFDKIYKLIVVSRFSVEKGLERLVDIFNELPENYHLNLVGVGVLENKIKQKVVDLGLSSRVNFLGQVENIQQLLIEHDLMLLSSYSEGFPNVVLESLNVGLPVVTFKVSGISGLIIDGFNGYVLEQGDLVGFKNKIIDACTINSWNPSEIKKDSYQK